jgi:hypothetical protein
MRRRSDRDRGEARDLLGPRRSVGEQRHARATGREGEDGKDRQDTTHREEDRGAMVNER